MMASAKTIVQAMMIEDGSTNNVGQYKIKMRKLIYEQKGIFVDIKSDTFFLETLKRIGVIK